MIGYAVRMRRVWPALMLATAGAASGCADRGAPRQALADEAPATPTPPAATARCGAPGPDSMAAVAAATAAISGALPLRVSSFMRHHEGALVTLVPVATDVAGGGGLVWVDRDGCVTPSSTTSRPYVRARSQGTDRSVGHVALPRAAPEARG